MSAIIVFSPYMEWCDVGLSSMCHRRSARTKKKSSEQRGLDRPIAEQNIRHDTEQTSRKSSKGEALHTKT